MGQQNLTPEIALSPAQQDYVAFTACGGLVPGDDNFGRQMTAKAFAEHWGVDRGTLYNWRKSIPNFWDKVNQARIDIMGKDRIAAVWNGMYLKAVGGNVEAAKLVLANFDASFKMPQQKVEVDPSESWTKLMDHSIASRPEEDARDTSDVLEGEVVELTVAEQIMKAREALDAGK